MNRKSRDRRRARLDKLEQRRLLGMDAQKKKPRSESIWPGLQSDLCTLPTARNALAGADRVS